MSFKVGGTPTGIEIESFWKRLYVTVEVSMKIGVLDDVFDPETERDDELLVGPGCGELGDWDDMGSIIHGAEGSTQSNETCTGACAFLEIECRAVQR